MLLHRSVLICLTAPEESIRLEQWQRELQTVIESYATLNHVLVRDLGEARLEE
jgi:hypothetical protein